MKKQIMLEQMEHICEEYILEAKQTAGRKRRSSRVLRAALVAACACVVLIGGAFAAEIIPGAGILEFFNGREYPGMKTPQDGYTVSFSELKQFAADEFSGDLRDWLTIPREERGDTREFEDWSAAEEFLGIELIDISILDELGKEYGINHQHCWGAFFETEGRLKGAEITAYYNHKLEEGCDLIVVAGVATEYQDNFDNSFWTSYWNADKSELDLEGNYVTPSGLSASIVKTPVGHEAFFSVNGVAFHVTLLNEPIETMHQILDALEF